MPWFPSAIWSPTGRDYRADSFFPGTIRDWINLPLPPATTIMLQTIMTATVKAVCADLHHKLLSISHLPDPTIQENHLQDKATKTMDSFFPGTIRDRNNLPLPLATIIVLQQTITTSIAKVVCAGLPQPYAGALRGCHSRESPPRQDYRADSFFPGTIRDWNKSTSATSHNTGTVKEACADLHQPSTRSCHSRESPTQQDYTNYSLFPGTIRDWNTLPQPLGQDLPHPLTAQDLYLGLEPRTAKEPALTQ